MNTQTNQSPYLHRPGQPCLSVVIPTLNEEGHLEKTLESLHRVPEVNEIIISDGGSTDHTLALAKSAQVLLIQSSPGRGRQIRHGCERANSAIIWVVHADTLVKPDSGAAIVACLQDPGISGGGCYKVFDSPSWIMRGSRFKCWVRHRLFQRVLADQTLFIRRSVLEKSGGFPDVPLMEEFILCKAIRKQGRLGLANTVVTTSARKFLKNGPLKTYLLMARITLGYWLGQDLSDLKKVYERKRPVSMNHRPPKVGKNQ